MSLCASCCDVIHGVWQKTFGLQGCLCVMLWCNIRWVASNSYMTSCGCTYKHKYKLSQKQTNKQNGIPNIWVAKCKSSSNCYCQLCRRRNHATRFMKCCCKTSNPSHLLFTYRGKGDDAAIWVFRALSSEYTPLLPQLPRTTSYSADVRTCCVNHLPRVRPLSKTCCEISHGSQTYIEVCSMDNES